MSLSPKLPWELANPKWAGELNPLLANPLVQGFVLERITLTTGVNIINHMLGRMLRGYVVILKSADVTLYDSQLINQKPELTLILNSSGAAVVSLYVF